MNMHTGRLMQGAPVREYASAAEMQRYAKELKARTFEPRPMKTAAVPDPVTIPGDLDEAWILAAVEEAKRGLAVQLTPLSRRQAIMRAIAEHHGVNAAQIKSDVRTARIVTPRQLTMTAIWIECPLQSLPQIGRMFGGRDHTTVLHAIRKYGVGKDRAWPTELAWLRDLVRSVVPALDAIEATDGWNGEGCA